MVEAQKLRAFYDFCWPRATLCGDSRGRGSITEDFLRFLRCARATLCGDSRGRGSKTEDFLRFLLAARDPLRGRVEALSLWRRAIFLLAKRPLEVVLWFARLLSQSRGRGFNCPLVRGSSGLKIAALKYKRSTRSVLLQFRLESRNFLSTNVVRGAHPRSSGLKIATFKYKRSMRSVLLQFRLESRNFLSTNVVRGAHPRSSGLKIATFKYKRSMRSVLPQLRLENRNF